MFAETIVIPHHALDRPTSSPETTEKSLVGPCAVELNPRTDGICVLRITGRIMPGDGDRVHARLERYCAPDPQRRGVLVDVVSTEPVSVVRLCSLVERLGGLSVPVAVLFSDPRAYQIARLLHSTLTNKDSVAYYTDRAAALAFLTYRGSR